MTVPPAPSVLSCLLPPVSRGPFLPIQVPQACRRVSPRQGEPLCGGGGILSVNRDKDPLDMSCDSSFQSRCREWWCVYMSGGAGGCQVYMHRRCYFRFIAVLECVFCVCTHSCSLPLMWPISLHACLCVCIRVDVGCFPRSVCVDRGHFLPSVCVT